MVEVVPKYLKNVLSPLKARLSQKAISTPVKEKVENAKCCLSSLIPLR